MKVRAAMSRGIDTYTYFYLLEHSRLRTLTLPKKEVLKAYKTSFFYPPLEHCAKAADSRLIGPIISNHQTCPKWQLTLVCAPRSVTDTFLFPLFFTKLHNIPRVIVIDLLYH